jgi:hypothetical protein
MMRLGILNTFKTVTDRLARGTSGLRGKYEAGFLFMLLMIIEWIIPGPASLAQITPHPFWVPVILLSVQYGSRSGLIVAAAASGLSWLAGWLPQTSQEDFYTYSLRVWREPVLWTGAALFIGGLRNRQIDERLALEERLHVTERQRDTIAAFCSDLQEDLIVHERRAATAPAGTIEAGLISLQHLREACEPAHTLPLLQAAVTAWLGDACWRIYPQKGSELGPIQPGQAAPDIMRAAVLVRTAMVLSIFDEADAELLDGVGVFACPIRLIGGGAIYGLFVVETVPVQRLVPSTIGAVLAIANALGEAFDRTNQNAASVGEASPQPPAPVNAQNAGEPKSGVVQCSP